MPLVLIALGGAAGATTRYLLDTWIAQRAGGALGLVPGLTEVFQAVQNGRIPLPVGIAILVGSLVLGVVIGWLILVLRRRLRTRDSGR